MMLLIMAYMITNTPCVKIMCECEYPVLSVIVDAKYANKARQQKPCATYDILFLQDV
jgi:hypothetical protein